MIDGIIFVVFLNINWKEVNYKDIKILIVLIDKKISMNKEILKGIVKINNFEGVYIVIKYLLDIGNKKIIYLSGLF